MASVLPRTNAWGHPEMDLYTLGSHKYIYTFIRARYCNAVSVELLCKSGMFLDIPLKPGLVMCARVVVWKMPLRHRSRNESSFDDFFGHHLPIILSITAIHGTKLACGVVALWHGRTDGVP
jgi:hypothetical protein